jgi:hypothetical protein
MNQDRNEVEAGIITAQKAALMAIQRQVNVHIGETQKAIDAIGATLCVAERNLGHDSQVARELNVSALEIEEGRERLRKLERTVDFLILCLETRD